MTGQAINKRQDRHLEEKIQNAVAKLKMLIDETEHYYGIVHESLPIIERNLGLTEQEINILINYFIESGETPHTADTDEFFLFAQVLQQVRNNFQEISALLVGQDEVNHMLGMFLGGIDKENSFQTFIELIDMIKETLSDINDISLNAIIFSSRLGDKGWAFAVVSDQILQTANFLEKEFLGIDVFLGKLNLWYGEFQNDVEGIIGNQERAIKEYIHKLEEIFGHFTVSIREINNILRNIMANVQLVVSPFQELMVLIQRQDIIRQNMENTIKCLQMLETKHETYLALSEYEGDTDKRLDHIVFISRVTGMTLKLVEGMSDQLVGSLDEISLTAKNLMEALAGVKEESQQLGAYLAGEPSIMQGNGTMTMVDYTFNDVFVFMGEFKKVLLNIKNRVNSLTGDRSVYTENIQQVQKSLETVQDRVSLLRKIKILARIELARINQQDAAIGQKIETVIEAVDQTVSVNRNSFFTLKGHLDTDLNRFEQLISRNQQRIDNALSEVGTSLERFAAANDISSQAVLALSREISELYEKLIPVNSRLQHTVNLRQTIAELKEQFQEIADIAGEQQKKEMQHCGVVEWQEKSEELLDLYKVFTGYLERLHVKEYLQADELDEGSAEGELTLF